MNWDKFFTLEYRAGEHLQIGWGVLLIAIFIVWFLLEVVG